MVVFKTRVGRYRYRDENAPDDAASLPFYSIRA